MNMNASKISLAVMMIAFIGWITVSVWKAGWDNVPRGMTSYEYEEYVYRMSDQIQRSNQKMYNFFGFGMDEMWSGEMMEAYRRLSPGEKKMVWVEWRINKERESRLDIAQRHMNRAREKEMCHIESYNL